MSEPIAPPDVSPVPLVVRSRRDPAATRRRWVERMGRFATSSLTVAEFCAAEGKASGGLVGGVREGTSPTSDGRSGRRDEFGWVPLVGEQVRQVGVRWSGGQPKKQVAEVRPRVESMTLGTRHGAQ